MYKIYLDSKSLKKRLDITEIVPEVNISFYKRGTASKLEFTVLKDEIISYGEGDAVYFYDDELPVFKGYVFTKIQNEKKEIKTVAYDQLRYLKAKQSFEFIGKSLAEIIKIVANYLQLNVGYIEEVAYKTPYHYHEDESCFDIIDYHVGQAMIQTGVELVFYDDFGELTLRKADDLVSEYVIGVESFTTGYSYKTDIDNDTYNIIKLVLPNKETGKGDVFMAKDDNTIKRWGMLQYYEVMNENLNKAQIKEYLKRLFSYHNKLFRTLKLDAIGAPGIRGGSTIFIDIPNIGDISINKSLLVDTVVHKFRSNDHTMSLEMEVR